MFLLLTVLFCILTQKLHLIRFHGSRVSCKARISNSVGPHYIGKVYLIQIGANKWHANSLRMALNWPHVTPALLGKWNKVYLRKFQNQPENGINASLVDCNEWHLTRIVKCVYFISGWIWFLNILQPRFRFKKPSKPIFERANVTEFSWCLSDQRKYTADHTPRESYACDKPNHEKATNCLRVFQKPPKQGCLRIIDWLYWLNLREILIVARFDCTHI